MKENVNLFIDILTKVNLRL